MMYEMEFNDGSLVRTSCDGDADAMVISLEFLRVFNCRNADCVFVIVYKCNGDGRLTFINRYYMP